jgi:ESF2/ABP1 family protein
MVEEINEYENIDLFQNPENLTNINEIKEKIRRSGLIYISNIPLGMTVNSFRKLLGDYGIERIYLVPLPEKISDENGKKIQGYKEGWIEFEDKIFAKLCEYQLNGKPIGGNKKCPYKDDLWTIKYLHKFKWHNLMEKINFDKNVRKNLLKTEIKQGIRENNFIIKNYEKSKAINKKRKREEEDNNQEKNNDEKNEFNKEESKEDEKIKLKKKFKQKKPIIKQ